MAEYQHFNGIVNDLQSGQRLDQVLAEIFPNYSRSRIKDWIINGLVRVNGQVMAVPKKKCLVVSLLR